MSDTRLVWHEFRYERRSFLRDPQALFFSVGLPLLYVVIFVSLFGNEQIDFVYESQPGPLKAHTLMLAGFVVDRGDLGDVLQPRGDPDRAARERHPEALPRHALADVGTDRRPRRDIDRSRDHGRCGLARPRARRVRHPGPGRRAPGTPDRPAALLGRVLLPRLRVHPRGGQGRRGRAARHRRDVALYFLSGNFFIIEERPLVLRVIGAAFPVKHLNDALLTPLNPNASGSRIEWVDLLVITAWGLAALLVALRWFRWTAARREA